MFWLQFAINILNNFPNLECDSWRNAGQCFDLSIHHAFRQVIKLKRFICNAQKKKRL